MLDLKTDAAKRSLSDAERQQALQAQPIGVFDSGVGGLTVVREIMRQIPEERLVYFGDTARVPYGSKSRDTVIYYSKQITRFLLTKNVKAIVIACNTATSFALEELEKELSIPVIGVVRPGAKVASLATENHRIGVIATQGTIESGIYKEYIQNLNPSLEVYEKACPLLVSLVEEMWLHDPITTQIVERYLEEMKKFDVDTLVLGCTHFPLLRSTIREVMGPGVNLVNPAYETAVELRRILEWKDLLRGENRELKPGEYKYEFYVSDTPGRLQTFASSILPYEVEHIEKIKIEEY